MRESERIRSVAAHYGSQGKLAKALGTTQSNVANWIQRGTLTTSAIKMFAERCPEISLEWLTRGQGVMLVGANMIDTPGHVDLGGNKRGALVGPTVKAKRRARFAELRNRALVRLALAREYGHYGQDGSPMTETIKAILQETSKQDIEAKKKSANTK